MKDEKLTKEIIEFLKRQNELGLFGIKIPQVSVDEVSESRRDALQSATRLIKPVEPVQKVHKPAPLSANGLFSSGAAAKEGIAESVKNAAKLYGAEVRKAIKEESSPSFEQGALVSATGEEWHGSAKTPEEIALALTAVREEIGDCTRCRLHAGRRNIVFGDGNPKTKLVFIGEGPGADEDREGLPFVGRAGHLLDRIIAAMGLSRKSCYICNVVKCRPPENRNPLPDEQAICGVFLKKQLEIMEPEVIVALGAVSANYLLENKLPISKLRNKWWQWRGAKMMPTFHPAYLLRNPVDGKPKVWEDMQKVMAQLGLEDPRNAKK